MTDAGEAREIIEAAHGFLNGDPDHIQEFLLAKEVEVEDENENESEEDSDSEKQLAIIKVPLHQEIHTELNGIFVEELYKVVSDVIRNDEKPLLEYSAGNINRDTTPVQYLPIGDIPQYDLFEPITRPQTFPEGSYDELGSADFQVLRVRDHWGNMFVAFRKFTRRQIVGSSWKVKLTLRGNEYDRFEEDLFALPEHLDGFIYNDTIFVTNQGKFEDVFNYFQEYEERTRAVLAGLEDSEITIHNADFFEDAIRGDRSALRKMAIVEESGLYRHLTKSKVITEIEKYGLNIRIDERNGEWGLILPNRSDKRDLIRLLNDDNLYSESTERRYQVGSKSSVE